MPELMVVDAIADEIVAETSAEEKAISCDGWGAEKVSLVGFGHWG